MDTTVDFIIDYVDRFISVCGSKHGDAVPMEPEEGVDRLRDQTFLKRQH